MEIVTSEVLLVGSRFSHIIDLRSDPDDPRIAGNVFLEKAKGHLHNSIESPNLTTIQALSIIGTFYIVSQDSLSWLLRINAKVIGTERDATGWLHHGMVSRLLLDMGLNLDPSGFEETRMMSRRETLLRRQTCWALYCHDKWASSYTGRVRSMLVHILSFSSFSCRFSNLCRIRKELWKTPRTREPTCTHHRKWHPTRIHGITKRHD